MWFFRRIVGFGQAIFLKLFSGHAKPLAAVCTGIAWLDDSCSKGMERKDRANVMIERDTHHYHCIATLITIMTIIMTMP